MVLNFRLKVGEGIVGAAVAEQRPMLVNDVHKDPRYLGLVPGVNAQLVVPLRHKKRVLGALNLLSDQVGAFTERDEQILAQFGVHVAQALANARMFEQERDYAETLETLTEIAREVARDSGPRRAAAAASRFSPSASSTTARSASCSSTRRRSSSSRKSRCSTARRRAC